MIRKHSRVLRTTVAAAVLLTAASVDAVGPTFSVDWQGPLNLNTPGPSTVADGFGLTTIDEGSILTTSVPGAPGPNRAVPGPVPVPGVMVGAVAGAAGSVPGGLGIMPAPNDALELDALSYGRDMVTPRGDFNQPMGPNRLFFSVDEFALGVPAGMPPEVASEGASGPAAMEASADVFRYLGVYGPMPPPTPPASPFNIDVIDGDGVAPFGGPGLGLIEPNPPTFFDAGLSDEGDNLDAVDVLTSLADVMGRIYFSLDSQFSDPFEIMVPAAAGPPNNGTAAANGFAGGDVLVSSAGGAPALFIAAGMLGLDVEGEDTDDLDALALLENGDGVAMPGPPGSAFAGLDEILFSVRRGSAVIGVPDSLFGIPIEEGDVLTVPVSPTGGPPPAGSPPSIFIFAEQLGLATLRSGQQDFGDDLDALDVLPEPTSMALLLCMIAGTSLLRRRVQ